MVLRAPNDLCSRVNLVRTTWARIARQRMSRHASVEAVAGQVREREVRCNASPDVSRVSPLHHAHGLLGYLLVSTFCARRGATRGKAKRANSGRDRLLEDS